MRLLTLNVWSGLDYQGYVRMGEYESAEIREKRYRALVAQIRRLAPDVIALQEANPLPAYAERLGEALGYRAFWHIGVSGVRIGPLGLPVNLREGDVLLVHPKWQPEFAGRRQLSGGYVGNGFSFHFDDATQIIAVRIMVQGQPQFVFATHWHASVPDSPEIMAQLRQMRDCGEITAAAYEQVRAQIRYGARWRLNEARMTRNFIREVAGEHLYVLLGDFNALPGSREVEELQRIGAVDTYAHLHPDSAGFTWDTRNNRNIQIHYLAQRDTAGAGSLSQRLWQKYTGISKRIDYVFCGPAIRFTAQGVQIRSSEVVLNRLIEGVQPSDHFGVLTELEFSDRGEGLGNEKR